MNKTNIVELVIVTKSITTKSTDNLLKVDVLAVKPQFDNPDLTIVTGYDVKQRIQRSIVVKSDKFLRAVRGATQMLSSGNTKYFKISDEYYLDCTSNELSMWGRFKGIMA